MATGRLARITLAWVLALVAGTSAGADCDAIFARVSETYTRLSRAEQAITPVLEEVRDRFRAQGTEFTLRSRMKTIPSISEKLERRERLGRPLEVEEMGDILGYRFVTNNPDEVKFIARAVQNALGRAGRIQDAANARGYAALHVNGQLRDGSRFEVQVMTRRMERWSNWDHARVYKASQGSEAYRQALRDYSRDVSAYLQRIDRGEKPGPRPFWESYGLTVDEAFPPELMN